MEDKQQRRASDNLPYKIKSWSGMVMAIGIIGSAILFVGSLFFQTRTEAKTCEDRTVERIATTEARQTQTERDVVEIKTDIKYIREGVKEIKEALR